MGVVFKGSGFYKTDSRGADKSSTPSTADDAGDVSVDRDQFDTRGDDRLDDDLYFVSDDVGLDARHGDVVDRHGLTGGRARQPFLVTADVGDVEEHSLQASRRR